MPEEKITTIDYKEQRDKVLKLAIQRDKALKLAIKFRKSGDTEIAISCLNLAVDINKKI